MRGKKTGRKENWEENIIPSLAWMEEGKKEERKLVNFKITKMPL